MKKLVALSAFIVFGFAAAYAQTPSKKAPAPVSNMAPASMQVAAPAASESVISDQAAVAETKKDTKDCSKEEKKACGTKEGKKSCCSSKAAK